MPYLERYTWPGNVRELENVIERAMLSTPELLHNNELDVQYLALVLPELCEESYLSSLSPGRNRKPRETDLHTVGKTAQLRHIQETLESCHGNLDEAARHLGISRTTLLRRLRSAGEAKQ